MDRHASRFDNAGKIRRPKLVVPPILKINEQHRGVMTDREYNSSGLQEEKKSPRKTYSQDNLTHSQNIEDKPESMRKKLDVIYNSIRSSKDIQLIKQQSGSQTQFSKYLQSYSSNGNDFNRLQQSLLTKS